MAVKDYFNRLTDTAFMRSAAVVFAGYMGTELLENMVAGSGVPGEEYAEYGIFGIVAIVLAEVASVSGQMKRQVQLGAATSTINTAASKFGVKNAVTEAV